MADEDEINLDDNGSSSSDKKGGLGGIFPSLLKWIIIGLAAVIVIVVVVVITVKITGKNSTTVTAIPASLSLRVFYGCGCLLLFFHSLLIRSVPADLRANAW